MTAEGPRRRAIKLGDSNDVFTVVEAGLKEGDEVVLNPFAFWEDASDGGEDARRSMARNDEVGE